MVVEKLGFLCEYEIECFRWIEEEKDRDGL